MNPTTPCRGHAAESERAEDIDAAIRALRLFIMGEAMPTRKEASKHLETLVGQIERGRVPDGVQPAAWAVSGKDLNNYELWQTAPDDEDIEIMNNQCGEHGPVVVRPLFFAAPAAPEPVLQQCGWFQDGEGSDVWQTSCGGLFSITAGSPSDNNMQHCPYCGKHLVEYAFEDDQKGGA